MISVCGDRVNDRLVRVKLACIVLFPAGQSARKKSCCVGVKTKKEGCASASVFCHSDAHIQKLE